MSIGMSFELAFAAPGIRDTVQTTENIVWWGRFEQLNLIGVMLSGAARDSGNNPVDVLRAGLLLGKQTSSGLWFQWNPSASDGTEKIAGVLMVDMKMTANGVNIDRFVGPIMMGGPVKASGLLIPGNASLGIAGDQYEYLVRAQMSQNGTYLFDDQPLGVDNEGIRGVRVLSASTNVTLTEADNDKIIFVTGGNYSPTITLPAPRLGLRFKFVNGGTGTVTVAEAGTVGGNHTMLVSGTATLAASQTAGAGVKLVVQGLSNAEWLAI